MKNTLINLTMFAVGAAIGSAVTWKLLKAKYELIAQEEIDSVKEEYAKFYADAEDFFGEDLDKPEEHHGEVPESLAKAYSQILSNTGYAGKNVKEEEVDDCMEKPYVIPPEEFDEIDGYMTCTLYCYEDGVITDVEDNIIEDADEIVGKDVATHFGEYEDDSVFVRNDARRCDYEILRDYDNYYDKHPTSMED